MRLSQNAIRRALSPERLRTYERAASPAGNAANAEALYAWNARISAAFLVPLHICEVVMRNAVSEAIARRHGAQWPWAHGFRESLPNPGSGYNLRMELQQAASGSSRAAAEVIPSLSLAFWQKMFTQRFDTRLWSHCFDRVLPGAASSGPWHVTRARVHSDLERIRRLRNRIAHHEPIFERDLVGDLDAMHRVVALRCHDMSAWMARHETVTALLGERPTPPAVWPCPNAG